MFYFGVLMIIESNLFSFFISLKGYQFNPKRAQCFIATVLLFIGVSSTKNLPLHCFHNGKELFLELLFFHFVGKLFAFYKLLNAL